jgi:hypothetical protein
MTQKSLTAGTGIARYAFNMVFDSDWSIRDAIEEVKKNCNGALVFKGEKLQFKLDKAESSVQVFTSEDIIAGSEEIFPLPKEEHYDICKIEYVSPDYEYAKVQAQAERATFFNTPGIAHDIQVYSVTNHNQAARLAWQYLNRNVLCPIMGKFTTDMRAYDREIGDVITLSDVLMGYSSKLVKITSIIDGSDGLLDIYWREYDADLYNDELGDLEPELTATNAFNINAYPGNVEGFTAKVFLNSILFTWQPVASSKSKYEIREGGSWDDSILIASAVSGLTASTELYGIGTKTYWIKAISEYGIYSQTADSDSITITDVFLRNNVVETDLINTGTTTASDCHISNDKLKPDILADTYFTDETPDTWADSGTRYYADTNNRWSYDCENSSYFETDEIDLGADLQSIWFLNYDFYNGGDTQNTVTFYWKYKIDGGSYQAEWVEFAPGSFLCRYAKFKIEFSNPNNVLSLLQNCYATADVPDRTEFYNDLSGPNTGLTVTFATHEQSKIAKPFTVAPAVVITPEDDSKTLTPVWTNRTKSEVTIYLYDKNDNKVAGTVDMTCKAY